MSRARIAVLASGGGSNLQALLDHFEALGERRAGDIVLVASNRSDAGALDRARRASVGVARIASRRNPDGDDIDALLRRHEISHIALAGYLALVPPDVVRRFRGRMLNVHPAPLPGFGGPGMYGARVHQRVLDAGAGMSGPTVHFVDEQFDHGASIAHWPVPVHAGDDAAALAARVLRAEHLLYPRVVQSVVAHEVVLASDGRVQPSFFRHDAHLAAFDAALDDATLEQSLDRARAGDRVP